MKVQLIKLKDKYLLLSDEEIKEGDWVLVNKDDVMQVKSSYDNDCTHENIWVGDSLNGYATYIEDCKKIISENPDFSLLSEEDCKSIGWVDVEKLAKRRYGTDIYAMEQVDDFIAGFQSAQYLNDKMFSLEQLKDTCYQMWYQSDMFHNSENFENWFKEHIQSLQQNVWDVEIDMERVRYPKGDDVYRPKIVDGKIKITKIL